MDFNKKREYLKKYRILQAKIARINSMMADCPEKYEKYEADAQNTRKLRDKIEEEIERVDGGILSEILFQKYICGKSMEQIGYAVNYSKRQIERLHLKALENFAIV